MPDLSIVRVALHQSDPVVGDIAGNAERILQGVAAAERAGAALVAGPELALTGYPPEDLLLKPGFVADNLAALHDIARQTRSCAALVGFVDVVGASVPDAVAGALGTGRVAREAAVQGAPRRLRNALALCAAGEVRFVYHKRLLPNYGVFDEERWFASGTGPLALCAIGGVLVGTSICEDLWFADGPVPALGRGGAQLVVNVNASPFAVGRATERTGVLRARAAQAGCPIAYVNQVGGQDELVFDGGSMVVGPDGDIVATAARFDEELLVVDVELPAQPPGGPALVVAARVDPERSARLPADPGVTGSSSIRSGGASASNVTPPGSQPIRIALHGPLLGRTSASGGGGGGGGVVVSAQSTVTSTPMPTPEETPTPTVTPGATLTPEEIPPPTLTPGATELPSWGAPGVAQGSVAQGGVAQGGATTLPSDSTEAEVYAALVLGTRDYLAKNGFTDAVVGLSGGIDSSLVAAVAVDALGAGRVHGVAMPSRYSSEGSVADARSLAGHLGIELRVIPIEPAHVAFGDMLAGAGTPAVGLTDENLQSRIRGVVLMALSNARDWIVLTTGNKSELATGYSTLYGDSAGGFAVIRDVPKTLVYRLCRFRNALAGPDLIPAAVLVKPPSAELRPDQRDDQSLPAYDVLDPILAALIDEDRTLAELVADGTDPALAERVARLVDVAEYKRRQSPVGIRITARAFGKDRRMPITHRYSERSADVRTGG